MPIYEFKCKQCQNEFEELFRSFHQKKHIVCPRCKSDDVERLLSLFGFRSGSTYRSSSGGSICSSCRSRNCDSCHL